MLDIENLIVPLALLLIVSIVLLLIAVFIIVSNKKLMEDFTTNISYDYSNYKDQLKEQNDTLTKQLLSQISNNNTSGNDTKENAITGKNLINIFVKLRQATKENCVTAMNKIGAVRIAIYLFHNGTHSTHGINFVKMSCICEKVVVGSGIREQMIDHTNIPINLFDEMIDKLITYNRYIIMNNEETQETNHKMFISADKISRGLMSRVARLRGSIAVL